MRTKFVLFRVTKAGSQALTNSLRKMAKEIYHPDREHEGNLIAQYLDVKNQDFSDYIRISHVREPWARLKSIYRYHVSERGRYGSHGPLFHGRTFEDFMIELRDRWEQDEYRRMAPPLIEATGWLQYEMDYILRFDHLNEDYLAMMKEMQLPHEPLEVGVNATDRGATHVVTPACECAFRDMYPLDAAFYERF